MSPAVLRLAVQWSYVDSGRVKTAQCVGKQLNCVMDKSHADLCNTKHSSLFTNTIAKYMVEQSATLEADSCSGSQNNYDSSVSSTEPRTGLHPEPVDSSLHSQNLFPSDQH
jgi:hypothetical protein